MAARHGTAARKSAARKSARRKTSARKSAREKTTHKRVTRREAPRKKVAAPKTASRRPAQPTSGWSAKVLRWTPAKAVVQLPYRAFCWASDVAEDYRSFVVSLDR